MQELIQIHDEPVFKPYKMYPETGDCADGAPTNVSKTTYGEEFAFRLAGKLVVKHAD